MAQLVLDHWTRVCVRQLRDIFPLQQVPMVQQMKVHAVQGEHGRVSEKPLPYKGWERGRELMSE